jgi:hypothetical protein
MPGFVLYGRLVGEGKLAGTDRERFGARVACGPIERPRLGVPWALDLATLDVPRPRLCVVRESRQDVVCGATDTVAAAGGEVKVAGTFSAITKAGRELAGLLGEGTPLWLAILGTATAVDRVKAGAAASVNGTVLRGPLDVWRKAQVMWVSVCAAPDGLAAPDA